ncbi:DUF7283 family protein [Haloparvum sedimenti]|uniref:DUF7283 family protein n=1 Tax=Haloparvum sedimenti TaxID=1678448 RepID=UPI00071E78C9|nr:hypothetical protein [Haloparvum sedimenti]
MFEVPLDGLYAWVGVAALSVAVLGVASALPSAPAPDAAGAAATVDSVAGGDYPATGEHGIAAERVRIAPERIVLDGERGTASAGFRRGPVTPVRDDGRLARVLHGAPPSDAFDSSEAFAAATRNAREAEPEWRTASDRLRIRRVHWGDVRVTLVG